MTRPKSTHKEARGLAFNAALRVPGGVPYATREALMQSVSDTYGADQLRDVRRAVADGSTRYGLHAVYYGDTSAQSLRELRPRAKPRTGRGGVAWNLKDCAAGQVLNPGTGLCVKATGAIGRALLAGKEPPRRKPRQLPDCGPGRYRHPETRRCRTLR